MKLFSAYATSLLPFIIILAGCQAALQPSDRQRDLSFGRIQKDVTSEYSSDLRSTYFVFASDEPLRLDVSSVGNSFDRKIDKESSSGMAVGITKDGYMLSAAHVIRRHTYVVGYMDGRIDASESRVVTKTSYPEFGAEYAVIKVDRSLDRPCKLARRDAGSIVYTVGANRRRGLWLEFLAGNVRSTRVLPGAERGTLFISDIPLWHGDSGGPLFTLNGELIGVNTAFRFGFNKWWLRYDRFSFAPDANYIESEIVRDRAQHKQANRALKPKTPVVTTLTAQEIALSRVGHYSPKAINEL